MSGDDIMTILPEHIKQQRNLEDFIINPRFAPDYLGKKLWLFEMTNDLNAPMHSTRVGTIDSVGLLEITYKGIDYQYIGKYKFMDLYCKPERTDAS